MNRLYGKPILLSSKQIQQVRTGRLITVRRKGQLLSIGKKGYTSRLSILLARKAKVNAAIDAEMAKV
jgi:hypothetical protein